MYGDPSSEPPAEARGTRDMPCYTRAWTFDGYHQQLRIAAERDPGAQKADTEWAVWEVFQQDRRGDHHHHVGSLHAPDEEIALVLAKESYMRRGACVNLWVVRAESIVATDYRDSDIFEHTTDKSYRDPSGFTGLRKGKIKGLGRKAAQQPAEETTR